MEAPILDSLLLQFSQNSLIQPSQEIQVIADFFVHFFQGACHMFLGEE